MLLVVLFLFLPAFQAVPAQDKATTFYGHVRDRPFPYRIPEDILAKEQSTLDLISVNNTESTQTGTGYKLDLYMNYEGNILERWNSISDIFSIYIILALDDPTRPTPVDQELFTDSVGNTQFRASWLPGREEFFPPVELTYDGVEWIPEESTTSYFIELSERVSRSAPWAQFGYEYSSDNIQDIKIGLMTRVTLLPDEEGSREYVYYYGINPQTFQPDIPLTITPTPSPTPSPSTSPAPFPWEGGNIQVITAQDTPEYKNFDFRIYVENEEWVSPPPVALINSAYYARYGNGRIEIGVDMNIEEALDRYLDLHIVVTDPTKPVPIWDPNSYDLVFSTGNSQWIKTRIPGENFTIRTNWINDEWSTGEETNDSFYIHDNFEIKGFGINLGISYEDILEESTYGVVIRESPYNPQNPPEDALPKDYYEHYYYYGIDPKTGQTKFPLKPSPTPFSPFMIPFELLGVIVLGIIVIVSIFIVWKFGVIEKLRYKLKEKF